MPPIVGSLTLAWNAIVETNMEYVNTCTVERETSIKRVLTKVEKIINLHDN